MINWFQRYFGKHFKWVLLVFLAVLLFSFIVGIGAMPRLNPDGGRAKARLLLGVDVNDPQVMQNLAEAAKFQSQYFDPYPITSTQDLQNRILQRIVLMHLADEWNIPEPTAAQLQDYLRSAHSFRDADGHFSNALYENFKAEVDAAPAAQREDYTTWLKDSCRLDRVRALLGGPGYTAPSLAQMQVSVEKAKADLEVGTLDYKKFEPKIELSGDKLNAGLQQIFDKDPSKFPRPAQASLSYVKFASAPAATDPTAGQLKDYATQHKDAFPGSNPDNLSDKDKKNVTDAWRAEQKDKALADAADKTMTYARELYSIKAKPGTPPFDALLKKYNLTLQTLPTITQGKPVPTDSPIPNDVLQDVAFALTADQPFAPVHLSDGAAVVFLLQATPARDSTFAEARDDVLKAFTDSEKARQFTEKGNAARDAIVKAMAAGKTFAEAAKAQGIEVKSFPAVTYEDISKTLNDMPFDPSDKTSAPTGPLAAMGRDVLTLLASSNNSSTPMLATFHVDEVSPLLVQNDTGAIFYVTKRENATVAADAPEVQHLQMQLQDQENYFSSSTILNQLVADAAKTLKPASP